MEIVHGVPGDSDSETAGAMGGKQSVARSARANGGIVHGSSSFDNGGFGVSGPNSAAKKGTARPPMPTEPGELEVLFNKVLVQMDLPPERAKHLRSVTYAAGSCIHQNSVQSYSSSQDVGCVDLDLGCSPGFYA